jgi:glycosyltransferase involved in cell wall biosynthesis
MKILCVIDSLCQGGAQRQLVELAIGLKEKGHEVSFLIYHQIPFFNHILESYEIQINYIQESNHFKRFIKIRSFIRKEKIDSILSFLESPNFICELVGFPFRKWKLVVGERSADPNIFKSYRLMIFRWFHFFADYVVANSYSNLHIVKSINPLLSQSKCKVIYNSIDFEKWKPDLNYTPRRSGKLRLIVASAHRYLKNLDGLLEALTMLTASELSCLSIEWYGVIEDSSMVDAIQKIKKYDLENVISFMPATSQIIKIIQNADIVGLFSFYEGFPNAICEGMACGKPVVCSAVSDIPLFLTNNKNLLFDPKDHTSICKTLKYILHLNNEELSKIGEQNYKCARLNFEKGNIIHQYMNLLS